MKYILTTLIVLIMLSACKKDNNSMNINCPNGTINGIYKGTPQLGITLGQVDTDFTVLNTITFTGNCSTIKINNLFHSNETVIGNWTGAGIIISSQDITVQGITYVVSGAMTNITGSTDQFNNVIIDAFYKSDGSLVAYVTYGDIVKQ